MIDMICTFVQLQNRAEDVHAVALGTNLPAVLTQCHPVQMMEDSGRYGHLPSASM